ncbi:MAG: precorrin-2 C(20)-methyltransferase [Desulfuromonadales bacterium]|nr:precorrin-2 C(20)-methyltransferase [Desulfuromonadales bacterium]
MSLNSNRTTTGPRVIAVGVGPGDPELVTLKGARLLGEADVVITPVGDKGDGSIARAIVAGLVDPARQEIVEQVFPMRRDRAGLAEIRRASARMMAAHVAAGRTVAFVTLGDPFLYSTFLYVYHYLREEFPATPVEVVSGVSSIHAAAARADLPLGLADERIAILPATFEDDRLRRALADFDTVVLMKVFRVFAQVRELLRELDLLAGAVYLKRVGLPDETVVTDLDQVRDDDLDYLSLIIVKKIR